MEANHSQGLKIDFAVAQYAPRIIALLANDMTARSVLGNEVADAITQYPKAEKIKNHPREEIRASEKLIMLAFVKATYPLEAIHNKEGEFIGYKQLNKTILRFICEAYLTHRHNERPILAEDFYKITENLRDFESFKKTGLFKTKTEGGAKDQKDLGDLNRYESYAEFLEVISPLQKARDAKKSAEAMRKLTPEQREIINQETTILYNGAEGQVVIPHTMRASQFWGANTKWCIAGTGKYDDGVTYAERHFPEYNKKSPIIMIIPKGMHDQKIALVDQEWWNAADDTVDELPKEHLALFEAMLKAQSEDVAHDIRKLIGAKKPVATKQQGFENEAVMSAETMVDEPQDIPPEWEEYLARFNQDMGFSLLFETREEQDLIPAALLANKKFVMIGVKREPNGLQFVSDALADDEEVVREAVQRDGSAVLFASERLRGNFEIGLIAVQNMGQAVSHLSDGLKRNRVIAMTAIAENSESYHYLDNSLRFDHEIAFEAFKRNQSLIELMPHALRIDQLFLLRCTKENIFALRASHLEPHQTEAIKIRACEELIAEGALGKVKNMFMRHEVESFGRIEAQFGQGDVDWCQAKLSEMKATMGAEARKAYDALLALRGEAPQFKKDGLMSVIKKPFKPFKPFKF